MATLCERAFYSDIIAICSLCVMSICILVVYHFGLEGGTLVLIPPVPGHCLPITFHRFSLTMQLKLFKLFHQREKLRIKL